MLQTGYKERERERSVRRRSKWSKIWLFQCHFRLVLQTNFQSKRLVVSSKGTARPSVVPVVLVGYLFIVKEGVTLEEKWLSNIRLSLEDQRMSDVSFSLKDERMSNVCFAFKDQRVTDVSFSFGDKWMTNIRFPWLTVVENHRTITFVVVLILAILKVKHLGSFEAVFVSKGSGGGGVKKGRDEDQGDQKAQAVHEDLL